MHSLERRERGKERGKKVVSRGKGGREGKKQELYNLEDWVLFKTLHIPN